MIEANNGKVKSVDHALEIVNVVDSFATTAEAAAKLDWFSRITAHLPETERSLGADWFVEALRDLGHPNPRQTVNRAMSRGGTTDTQVDAAPLIVCADQVKPRRVEWLWHHRVPLGKITLISGDPNVGKSTLFVDLHARVSTGRAFPDGAPAPCGPTLILTAEDAPDDTLVPRLMAAEADLSKVHILGGGERRIVLPDDMRMLAEAVERIRPTLVTIDPITEFLSGDTNTWKDDSVRAALNPPAGLAREFNFALIASRHLNKSSNGRALYRGGGSIAFTALARTEYLAARDPENPTRVILAEVKNNLAPSQPSLSYTLEGAGEFDAVRVCWAGTSALTADQLCVMDDPETKTQIDEAKDFLSKVLEDGPVSVPKAKAEASAAGLSWRTVQRAQSALRLKTEKVGFGGEGPWYWSLPVQPSDAAQERQAIENEAATPF